MKQKGYITHPIVIDNDGLFFLRQAPPGMMYDLKFFMNFLVEQLRNVTKIGKKRIQNHKNSSFWIRNIAKY